MRAAGAPATASRSRSARTGSPRTTPGERSAARAACARRSRARTRAAAPRRCAATTGARSRRTWAADDLAAQLRREQQDGVQREHAEREDAEAERARDADVERDAEA